MPARGADHRRGAVGAGSARAPAGPAAGRRRGAPAPSPTRSPTSCTFLRLWNALQERVEHKKSNRHLAEELRQDFINGRRVREWRDVHGQLLQIVGEQGWRVNASAATYEQVHRALLTGLLGNVGMKSGDVDPADRREPPFLGARGIKFHLWPGSPKARRAARWIVAAELVETSRLYARTVADVDPVWIERCGAPPAAPQPRRPALGKAQRRRSWRWSAARCTACRSTCSGACPTARSIRRTRARSSSARPWWPASGRRARRSSRTTAS